MNNIKMKIEDRINVLKKGKESIFYFKFVNKNSS